MHTTGQISSQPKPAEAELVLPDFNIDVHRDRHRRFALLGLRADDDRVVRYLDRGRWQLANRDLPFGDQQLAGHRQPITLQGNLQVGRRFELRVRLHRNRQARALQADIDIQRLCPANVPTNTALPVRATGPVAFELHVLTGDQRLHVELFQADRQFRTGHLAIAQRHVAVDLWRQEAA